MFFFTQKTSKNQKNPKTFFFKNIKKICKKTWPTNQHNSKGLAAHVPSKTSFHSSHPSSLFSQPVHGERKALLLSAVTKLAMPSMGSSWGWGRRNRRSKPAYISPGRENIGGIPCSPLSAARTSHKKKGPNKKNPRKPARALKKTQETQETRKTPARSNTTARKQHERRNAISDRIYEPHTL